MIPVLFDRYSTRSIVGVLDECISCTVTEEINGIFECTFTYPINGQHFERLLNYGGVVYVSHAHGLSGNYKADYFDIYKYSAPINGIVTFYASHVSYRLTNLIARGGWTAADPYELMRQIVDNALTRNEFSLELYGAETFGEGVVTAQGYENARRLLLGREGAASAVNAWRCEFEFVGFQVFVKAKRGQNNGVEIRYGKNLTNFQREKDDGDIVSAVFPYWHDQDFTQIVEGEEAVSPSVATGYSPWTTTKNTIVEGLTRYYDEPIISDYGEIFFRPAIINAAAVDFSDKFESAPTIAALRREALAYMRKDSTWRPKDNITIDFIDLYNTPEYADVQEMEKCNLGDYVNVFYPQLGVVAENVEIVSVAYDTLADRYTQMQLGTIKTTLAQTIIDYIGGVYK